LEEFFLAFSGIKISFYAEVIGVILAIELVKRVGFIRS